MQKQDVYISEDFKPTNIIIDTNKCINVVGVRDHCLKCLTWDGEFLTDLLQYDDDDDTFILERATGTQ